MNIEIKENSVLPVCCSQKIADLPVCKPDFE